jgi:hypothetical protein
MKAFDESRISSKIQSSLGVQHIRVQIEQMEAELERAEASLMDLPASLRRELLAKPEASLRGLYEREATLLAQARRTAEAELRAERVDDLRMEAEPLLKRAAKNLEIMKADLAKVAKIEAEARANGGRVMTEAFDQTSIAYFIPTLTYEKGRRTWLLKR